MNGAEILIKMCLKRCCPEL